MCVVCSGVRPRTPRSQSLAFCFPPYHLVTFLPARPWEVWVGWSPPLLAVPKAGLNSAAAASVSLCLPSSPLKQWLLFSGLSSLCGFPATVTLLWR